MEFLNQNSTTNFISLIEKMNDKLSLKINSDFTLPLTIEKLADNITSIYGIGIQFSLTHSFLQNGLNMKCPQMCFVAFGLNDISEEKDVPIIIPYLFQQDKIRLYQESLKFRGNELIGYNASANISHVNFANQWLDNIDQQGFLH